MTSNYNWDRGLPVIRNPGAESVLEIEKKSPFFLVKSLAEMGIVPKVIFSYFDKISS